jgi:nicotinamide-nucleotide amidase
MEVMPGTAPGLICPVGQGVVYAVPGVPSEMRAMVSDSVLPDLRRRSGSRAVIRSRVLKTWGVSESRLAEMLAHRVTALEGRGNPTLAFLASGAQGIKVRITAKGESAAQAEALVAAEERPVRNALGDIVFAVDDQTMEEVVLAMLRERGLSLGCAESLTGGLLGGRITAAPGSSDVYVGGLVAYQGRIKHQLLEVPDGPVVSAQAAEAMASGARRLLGCDVALATTGVAGPDPQEDQPVGTVFIALAMGDEVESHRLRLPGRRQLIRDFTVISALEMLRRRLGQTPAQAA